MNLYRIQTTLYLICACIAILFAINFTLIKSIVVNDNGEELPLETSENAIFKLFYTVSSNTGYQAEPTTFNFFFTALLGVIAGIYLSKAYFKNSELQAESDASYDDSVTEGQNTL